MSIAVSVQNWKFTARHNGGGVRQESAPQSATFYTCNVVCNFIKKAFRNFESIPRIGTFEKNNRLWQRIHQYYLENISKTL
jgi:hypothetical protein